MTPKSRVPDFTSSRSVAKAQNWVTAITAKMLAHTKKTKLKRIPACPTRENATRLSAKNAMTNWKTRFEAERRTSSP